jgi:uncharacterized protein YneF (UPF0154 family)
METMNIIAMGVCFGIGVVVGMYITTQIGEWIDRQIRRK